mmetsp:Transcript_16432/g.25381  ORF Transcript_16432/g.25381 Transcript_16432/m.25381 type:complete len:231 (-) Transcript_16432:71-763(-)
MDHPNIVKLLDVFEDEKYLCLVMELMTGGELFDLIIEKEQFSELEAREATRSLIDAIGYCHSRGICHRDIKPENLLLQSKELGLSSLKLADFGLARLLDEKTMLKTMCGSPGYVAPEVLEEKPYGKQCDCWSIGVVTYILLSGIPPFFADDNVQLFEQIIACKYDFTDENWTSVSTEAKDFIARILTPNPEKRLNLDDMLVHPWMKMKLSDENLTGAKTRLSKYMRDWKS